jgi:hypothetical protein
MSSKSNLKRFKKISQVSVSEKVEIRNGPGDQSLVLVLNVGFPHKNQNYSFLSILLIRAFSSYGFLA